MVCTTVESMVNETVVLPAYVKALVALETSPPCNSHPQEALATPGVYPWNRETNSFKVVGDVGEVFWTFFAKRCDIEGGVEPGSTMLWSPVRAIQVHQFARDHNYRK